MTWDLPIPPPTRVDHVMTPEETRRYWRKRNRVIRKAKEDGGARPLTPEEQELVKRDHASLSRQLRKRRAKALEKLRRRTEAANRR